MTTYKEAGVDIDLANKAVVKIKDPEEYLKRLEFHKNARGFEDYFI